MSFGGLGVNKFEEVADAEGVGLSSEGEAIRKGRGLRTKGLGGWRKRPPERSQKRRYRERKARVRQSFHDSGVGLFPVALLSTKSSLEECPHRGPSPFTLYQMINQAFQGKEEWEGPARTS